MEDLNKLNIENNVLDEKCLINWLERSSSESIRYYKNPQLLHRLSRFLISVLGDLNLKDLEIENLRKLILNNDIRSFVDYLRLLKSNSNYQPSELLASTELSLARYESLSGGVKSRNFVEVDKLESLFSTVDIDSSSAGQILYRNEFGDDLLGDELVDFLRLIGCDFTEFYKAQFDLPGINSLVRRGLVKDLYLPSGQRLVVKRDNPNKVNRFRVEQENIMKLVVRLDLKNAFDVRVIDNLSDNRSLEIQMVRPLAVLADRENEVLYSFMPFYNGITFEEVLRSFSNNKDKQDIYLEAVNKLLEFLYSAGVEWGDFAPRNILVNRDDENVLRLVILDFEKTKLVDDVLSFSDRVEHCRGPMCVEEFGALCDLDQLKKAFGPYFDPIGWDTVSSEPVSFKKPKRELKAIFDGRGIDGFNLGQYNVLEQEVMGVRLPFVKEDGVKVYPLEGNFKVDHYFGADYDRKLTEILLEAKRNGLLVQVVELINWGTRIVDDQMYLVDFQNLFPDNVQRVFVDDLQEKGLLLNLLDDLDGARITNANLESVICRYNRLFDLYDKIKRDSEFFDAFNVAEFMAIDGRSRVYSFLRSINSKINFVLGGGFARGEATWYSDADILPVGDDAGCLLEFCRIFENKTGLKIELYPVMSLHFFEKNFSKYPNLFLDLIDFDFDTLEDRNLAENLKNWRNQFLADREFLASALHFRVLAYERHRNSLGQIWDFDVRGCKLVLRDLQFLQFLLRSEFVDSTEIQLDFLMGLRSEIVKLKSFRELVPNGCVLHGVNVTDLELQVGRFYEHFKRITTLFLDRNLSERQLMMVNAQNFDDIKALANMIESFDSTELFILISKKWLLPDDVLSQIIDRINSEDLLADLRD